MEAGARKAMNKVRMAPDQMIWPTVAARGSCSFLDNCANSNPKAIKASAKVKRNKAVVSMRELYWRNEWQSRSKGSFSSRENKKQG